MSKVRKHVTGGARQKSLVSSVYMYLAAKTPPADKSSHVIIHHKIHNGRPGTDRTYMCNKERKGLQHVLQSLFIFYVSPPSL